jgi:formamidopyrimidine-DNA glycosylase
MPELPEVETCVQGLKPLAEGKTIKRVVIRNGQLRWPVKRNLNALIRSKRIQSIARRAKYIVIDLGDANLLMHLGMSGTVRVLPKDTELKKHDHIDIELDDTQVIRYNDPRRFGSLHHTTEYIEDHFLIDALGPEPLDISFSAEYLFNACSKRSSAIKTVLMNNKVVVGVGNIYANEALFLSGIHPQRSANSLSHHECEQLCRHIKQVLARAIEAGGTTLKDFVNSEGKPGYFQQTLYVYGRSGKPCLQCSTSLDLIKIAGRATVVCPTCQEY